MTIRKWIAGVTFDTSTYWCMIYNIADGIETARTWTWIFTFLSNTC